MSLKKTTRRDARVLVIAILAVLALVTSVASATTSAPPKPKPKSGVKGAKFTKSTKGAKGEKGSKGEKGDHGDKGDKGEGGSVGPAGPAGPQGPAGPAGATGPAGAIGPAGPAGPAGAAGAKGENGAAGAKGEAGAAGAKGDKGDKGDSAPSGEYGVAVVRVDRGAGNGANPNTVYSTDMGSPVGDTTGGTFRFTCRSAVCRVSLQAKILSDGSTAPGRVYPRVLIHRGGSTNGPIEPMTYCEYGDGPTNTITRKPKSDSTPTGDPLTINIGGSADCGVASPAGDVTEILVPEGYYDVWSTFQFYSTAA